MNTSMERLSNLIAENKKYIILAIISGVIVYFLLIRNAMKKSTSSSLLMGGAVIAVEPPADLVLTDEQKKYLTPEELIIVNGGQEEIRKYFQSILDTVKNIIVCKDIKEDDIRTKCLGDNNKFYLLSINRNDKEGLGEMYHSLIQYSAIKQPSLFNVKMAFVRTLNSRILSTKAK